MFNFVYLSMIRLIENLKYFKWLFSNRILTLEDKNDVYVYTFKIPLYVRLSQCIDCILRDFYNIIWTIIPYSEKWYYRFLPHLGIDNWWFNKLKVKYNL